MTVVDNTTNRLRAPRHAVLSAEGISIAEAQDELDRHLARPASSNVEKWSTLKELYEMEGECGEPGWDGYDAQVVSRRAVGNAVSFIEALPPEFPLPEVAPEPDGSVELDWFAGAARVVSVSISESDRIAYAYRDGTDSGHGVARFDGESVPAPILHTIRTAIGFRHAPIRSS